MARRIIYWFRNDLRLNDNEALFTASDVSEEIVPVFVFDPRQFENTRLGFRRTSALRAQFLIDCVTDLRNRLREKGGDLLIRIGEPEKIIAQLADAYGAEYVYTSKEIGPEETRIESSLSKNLKTGNVDIRLFWMDTLVHALDLPFPIAKLPTDFHSFYEGIKDNLKVKGPFPEPESIRLPQEFDAGHIPSLPALGIDPAEIRSDIAKQKAEPRGESQALLAFAAYLNESAPLPTEQPLIETGLSEWLSLGCLSPAYIFHYIQEIEASDKKEAMLYDLLKRDYFHLILLRYGPRLFKPSGVKHEFTKRWTNDRDVFEKWVNAQTENNEVNETIEKLKIKGSLNSAERMLAAAYLVNVLGVNWTWGAMFFESNLKDYEVSVSWGKWNNLAGVGLE